MGEAIDGRGDRWARRSMGEAIDARGDRCASLSSPPAEAGG
jgi:hypothetical protein